MLPKTRSLRKSRRDFRPNFADIARDLSVCRSLVSRVHAGKATSARVRAALITAGYRPKGKAQ